MDLPKFEDLDVSGKRVLLRADLDLPAGRQVLGEEVEGQEKRLEAVIPIIDYLGKNNAEIVLLGHRGRPGGKEDAALSLEPVAQELEELLKNKLGGNFFSNLKLEVMENLRFNPGEEANDQQFARHLASRGDIYVNEAFAASHREHASIVSLPKLLPHAAGFHFFKEYENLSRVLDNPKRPVVVIISGVKEDKVGYVEAFAKIADKILIGGRLPEQIHDDSPLRKERKFIVADLTGDKEDITVNSIENFERELAGAGTVVVSGPLGKFEEEGHRQGTQRVFTAVANSSAFKVAGGGDTLKAISVLGLDDKFDWLSIGGGSMLEFLTKGTLPGIEALLV